MGIILQFSRYIFKPPTGVRVEFGHPLVIGMVGCWLFRDKISKSLIDEYPLTATGSVRSNWYGDGTLATTIGSSAVSGSIPSRLSLSGSRYSFVLISFIESGGWHAGVFRQLYLGFADKLRLKKDGYGTDLLCLHNNTEIRYDNTKITWNDLLKPAVIVQTYDGTSIRIYLDGVKKDTQSIAEGPGSYIDTMYICYCDYESQTATVNAFYLYKDRTLNDLEVQQISLNPYQIFSVPRKYWFGVAGAVEQPAFQPWAQMGPILAQ